MVLAGLVLFARAPGYLVGGADLGVRLQQALAGASTLTFALQGAFPSSKIAVLSNMNVEDVRRRASTVPGWDTLAMIGPYQDGADIADDPAIRWTPSWLSVSTTSGWEYDSIFTVLAIRHGFVVARFDVRVDSGIDTCVVSRE
jgi:hypothetical protein